VAATVAAILGSLYGAEMLLSRICGWELSWRMPFALLMRDAILPVMFVDACLFDDFVWHGNEMTVREEETTTAG
jgi:ceramide glucosyltransferase